ncbi:class I SAM-dependent methyltransferase [soil metagenome]
MSGDVATRPFDGATAKRIARAFLPTFPLGNRYDYYYTLAKLRSDPLYPGVLAALRGTRAPLLDLGCGLGLLAHALRLDGQAMAYRGVDVDARKITRAGRIAARTGLCDTGFEIFDLAHGLPQHDGSVTLLDVLQYLSADAQRALLDGVVSMLTPGARLVIRTGLADGSGRAHTTRITDRLAHVLGWMQAVPKHYPTRESLCAPLSAAGLTATFEPLYADTPFNNWLVVASR